MHMNISGSSSDFEVNPIVGSMHFYQNGELEVSLIEDHDKVSFADMSTLLFTTEFLMYAVEREDWLLEYMAYINDSLKKIDGEEKKKRFTVIEGGLKDDKEPDNQNT